MQQLIQLVNEMSPYLLLGFLAAGIMHTFVPGRFYTRYLSGRNFASVIYAAMFGIPLPLCSCGVIPTAMSLRREGASRGAVVSFLIATPQTGMDSILATYSLMGLPFALVRPIAALVTAVMGGTFVNIGDDESLIRLAADKPAPACPADRRQAGRQETHTHKTFAHKIAEALRYAFVEMMADIGKWLVTGLVIAGIITVFVPESLFSVFQDDTLMSMLLVLCISIPMYLCATGSIPIAVALMMKGLTPGAALVLLMAGPASNAASILVINKVLGRKTMVVYLASIICGAMAFGCCIDFLMPREWFTTTLASAEACCTDHDTPFQWASTILLVVLLLNVLRIRLTHRQAGHTCTCGHCHDHGHTGHHTTADLSAACLPNRQGQACQSVTITVKGMNCTHCRASVHEALAAIDEVSQVSVDLHTGEAHVTGTNLDVGKLKDAVRALGFDA